MSARILLIFAFLITATAAIADDGEWNVSQLTHQFSRIVHAELAFTETRRSTFIVTDLITTGTIEYRSPGYIVKQTVSPIVEKVVIDVDSVLIEKTAPTGKTDNKVQLQRYRVQSHPILATAVESLRAMLAGNSDRLKENFAVNLDGGPADWQLALTPKTPEMLEHFERITLHGSANRIQKVVSIQADGDQSTLDLTYLQLQTRS